MVNVLAIILLALMLAVGRDRGLQSFFTILMNMIILLGVLYAIALGLPPLPAGMVAGILLTVLILFYQNGNNLKTQVAFGAIAVILVVLFVIGAAL